MCRTSVIDFKGQNKDVFVPQNWFWKDFSGCSRNFSMIQSQSLKCRNKLSREGNLCRPFHFLWFQMPTILWKDGRQHLYMKNGCNFRTYENFWILRKATKFSSVQKLQLLLMYRCCLSSSDEILSVWNYKSWKKSWQLLQLHYFHWHLKVWDCGMEKFRGDTLQVW